MHFRSRTTAVAWALPMCRSPSSTKATPSPTCAKVASDTNGTTRHSNSSPGRSSWGGRAPNTDAPTITTPGGDECLSFDLAPAVGERIGGGSELWQIGCVPPLPELMVAGELAQTAAEGRGDVSLEEAGWLFITRCVDAVAGRRRKTPRLHPRDRRRAVEAALWL